MISRLLGKTERKCVRRYSKLTNQPSPKNVWTAEEDERLKELVQEHGKKNNWVKIASFFPNRINDQCRERYFAIAEKGKPYKKWDKQEDKLLCRLYYELDGKWAAIAEAMSCRSRKQAKNRYYFLKSKDALPVLEHEEID